MVDINVTDHSFDLKKTSSYHLSIQASLDGFSFCILDQHTKKYLVFRHTPLVVGKPEFLAQKIETIFEQDELLNPAYQSVSMTYSTNKATLIPKEFAEPATASQLFGLTANPNRTETLVTNNIPGFNDQLLFSCPQELLNVFNSKYTDFRFRHKSIPLLLTALTQRNENRNTLIINFEKKYIRIIALKGSQIYLYNSFYYKNESDVLYYTLNIYHQLQLKPETDETLIGGYVASESGYIRQLKKYLGIIRFLKPFPDYDYGTLFEQVQSHQFVSLLNSYECE
jgi:hypothetical protein